MMPRLDGIEVTKRLKSDKCLPFTPIILLTAKCDTKDVVQGLDIGADEYLTKPVDYLALGARLRAMLRIKALHDEVQHQAARLDAQARELATLNADLEARVALQVEEIARVSRLKRFLAPQLAEIIVKSGDITILKSHRRDIVVVFADLRGFTAFAETSEPEDVMTVIGEYHNALGPLIHAHEGTIERYSGDGVLVFFNDPLPCPDPAPRAVKLACAMREAVGRLAASWRARSHDIGFGVGIAQGYATLGQVGFEGRVDYAPIGTVTNVAARLCSEAKDGQILVSQRVAEAIKSIATAEDIGPLALKGLSKPVKVYNVTGLVA
jgi:adenylate cyclase